MKRKSSRCQAATDTRTERLVTAHVESFACSAAAVNTQSRDVLLEFAPPAFSEDAAGGVFGGRLKGSRPIGGRIFAWSRLADDCLRHCTDCGFELLIANRLAFRKPNCRDVLRSGREPSSKRRKDNESSTGNSR